MSYHYLHPSQLGLHHNQAHNLRHILGFLPPPPLQKGPNDMQHGLFVHFSWKFSSLDWDNQWNKKLLSELHWCLASFMFTHIETTFIGALNKNIISHYISNTVMWWFNSKTLGGSPKSRRILLMSLDTTLKTTILVELPLLWSKRLTTSTAATSNLPSITRLFWSIPVWSYLTTGCFEMT